MRLVQAANGRKNRSALQPNAWRIRQKGRENGLETGIVHRGDNWPAPSETTVLVTGASGGIGAAIAERFAAGGYRVAIHYRANHEGANETARRCLARGAAVLTVAADLRSKEQILRMRDKLDHHGMSPDILVNNAGVAHYGLLSDVTEEDWDRVMDINLKGMFLCTQAFMPRMIRRRYGRIINVSSIWGITGASCEVVYSTAKGGVNAFTKALAKELAPSGVTVNAVAPGAVDTSMLDNLDDEDRRLLIDDIPAGRLAQPEEIASLVYFLALPESGYMTGQIISPNGGIVT
jgi:3-oxoacyl-[acyl-carrier protein] reductase